MTNTQEEIWPVSAFNPAIAEAELPRKNSATLIWVLAACACALIVALFLARQATLLRLAFPLVTGAVAVACYLRRPGVYIQFTMWIWILTPCVRRIVDWRCGFENQNLILLTPLFVTAISAFTVLYKSRDINRFLLVPFVLCTAGVFFGFFSGIIHLALHLKTQESFPGMVYGLAIWICPILFALYIALEWRQREEIVRAISSVYFWSLLLTGAYTLFQYVTPWPWDIDWLNNVKHYSLSNNTFGEPESFHLRVWGTLNSPGTFATFLLCAIVLVTFMKPRLRYLALLLGYIALMISMVRIMWISWLLAMALVALILRSKGAMRMVITVVLIPLAILPALYIATPDKLTSRFSTLTDIRSDSSYQERQNMYVHAFDAVLSQPSGYGLGQGTTNNKVNTYVLDSGILQILYSLGIQGTIFYATGLLFAVSFASRIIRSKRLRDNEFMVICGILFLVLLLNSLSGNIFINFAGMLMWLFVGLLIQYLATQSPGEQSPKQVKKYVLSSKNALQTNGDAQ